MKFRTAELEGRTLDVVVGLAERVITREHLLPCYGPGGELYPQHSLEHLPRFSTEWTHGGQIIERERITLHAQAAGGWVAWIRNEQPSPAQWPIKSNFAGPTPLIAAMRTFVASKLGEEVELP